MAKQIQTAGFYLSGVFRFVLAILKLTIAVHWLWWRVLLPLWVILGHNALYLTVGFVWLLFVDGRGAGQAVTIRQDDCPDGYQLAAMLCFFIFANSLLGRIGGHGETAWFWPSSGSWKLMFVSGVLSLVCQLLFWHRVLDPGHSRTRAESSGPPET